MKRRIFLILIIFSCILGLAAGIFWYTRHNRSSRLLARIELAVRAEKLDKAMNLADRYIMKYPDDWRGYHLQARICIRSGRYKEARQLLNKLLAETEHLKPNQVSTTLLLADTYALPAKRSLFLTETSEQKAALKTAIEQLREANKVLSQTETDDKKAALNLQQAMGMNQADIGRALLRLSYQFNAEAEIAATARAEYVRKQCLEQGEVALKEAQEILPQAIETLLAVVILDTSRHDPARTLVQLCIQQGDQKSLQAARAAILSAEKPAPIATMMLIVHDLKMSYTAPEYEHPERQAKKEKVLKAAQKLDELLEQYPDEVQIKLQRASLALMLSDLSTVERLVSEILSKYPRQGQARLIEAKMLLMRGETSQAESKLFSLKAEFLQWAEPHYIYAQAALALGKEELARQAMRRVTELEPDHPGARRYLAESLIRDGFYEQAFLDAQEYYRIQPENPVAVMLIVTSAFHTDQPDLTYQILEEAKTNYDSNPIMLMTVAGGYAMLGDKTNMLEVLQLAADSEPTTMLGRLAQARALVRLDRIAQAEKILLDELAKDPQHARVNFVLGRIYAETGRNLQALEQYRQASRLDSNNDEYRLAIARVLLEVGDLAQCQEVLEQVSSSNTSANLLRLQFKLIQGQPLTSDEALQQMGFAGGLGVALTYLQSGRPEDCIDICQTELARNRDSTDVRMLLGQAYLALGQKDKSLEQLKILLQMAPRKLSNYLLLARLLSSTNTPSEIAKTLAFIPNVESYMIDLTIGWLYERNKKYTLAFEAYDRAAKNTETTAEPRNLARLFMARTLAAQGQIDQAIAELDKISRDKISGNRIDFLKARMLLGNQRTDEALLLLETLCQTALKKQDRVLLRKIVKLYLDLNQTSEALDVCDKVLLTFPKDPEPHLLRASVLVAAGRRKEAIDCYRKAIVAQPSMFAIYRTLAQALDDEQEPLQALDVLDDLESFGSSGRSAALFERGALFRRWGLQKQAAECYEALAASGYGGNPKLQLFLGKVFAKLGEKDRAINIIAKIPEYVSEYSQAQLLLAQLTDNTEKKLNILRPLQADNPADLNILMEIMHALLAAESPDEALLAFRSFVDDYGINPAISAKLRSTALPAILQADDRSAAISLCIDIAKQKDQTFWRHLAILLTIDNHPDLTTDLFPEVSQSNLYDAFLGLCFACRTNNTNLAQQWFNRINQLYKQFAVSKNPQTLPVSHKIFSCLALGETKLAQAELARLAHPDSIDYIIASELVSYSSINNDRSEAAKLLKAHVALDLGIPSLASNWALALLKARPSSQWSAALAVASAVNQATMHEVLKVLQPKDCALTKAIDAELLLKEKQYEKAAKLYAELATAGQTPTSSLLNQAIALESAGRLEQALQVYRHIFETTGNPIAANNAAYVASVLYPKDNEKLAEAQEWINATIIFVPDEPTFRDTKAWIAYLQGHHEQASKDLHWAVKRLPDSPEVHYHLGMTEIALNHNELARWHLTAAADIGQKQLAEETDMSPTVAKLIRLAQETLQKIEQNQP